MNRSAVAALAGLLCVMAPPIAHAAAATGTDSVVLTPSGPSTLTDVVTPLAGSASALVYSRQSFDADDADRGLVEEPTGTADLMVRSASGSTKSLGALPAEELSQWSLVGSVLAAGIYDYSEQDRSTTHVDVWNVTTGKRRTVTLAKGDNYLSAGPGGVVYSGADGVVKLRTLTGTVTKLGKPFGATSPYLELGAADSTDLVVSDGLKVDDLTFAAPHTVTALDSTYPSGSLVDAVLCHAVVAGYAACTDDDFDEGYESDALVLLPLDGSTATVPASPSAQIGSATLAGSNLVYTVDNQVGNAYSNTYSTYSEPSGSSTSSQVGSPSGYQLTSAYGDAVEPSADQTSLLAVSSTNAVSRLVGPHASPVTAEAFALSAHKVVYTDDERVESRPGQLESAFSRSLTTHGSQLIASAPRLLSTGDTAVDGRLVGASRSLSVYADASASPPADDMYLAHVHVVSAKGVHTIDDVSDNYPLQVVGSDVLFYRPTPGKTNGTTTIEVYDASTGETKAVTDGSAVVDSAAPWKSYVAFALKDGAVYRMSLSTGRKVKLAGALSKARYGNAATTVVEYGNQVGWQVGAGSLGVNRTSKPFDRIRNAKTLTPAVSPGRTLYALTSAGALLDSGPPVPVVAGPFTSPVAAAFWVRSYSGHTRALLSKRAYLDGPQIAGHVLAWVPLSGAPKARRISRGSAGSVGLSFASARR